MIDSAGDQPLAFGGRARWNPQPLSERGQVCDYVACRGMVGKKRNGKKSLAVSERQ